MWYIIGVVLGYLGILVVIARFGIAKTRKGYLLLSILGFITTGGSYFFLHDMQGFSIGLAAVTSNIFQLLFGSLKADSSRLKVYRYFTVVLFGAIGVLIAPPVSLVTSLPLCAYILSRVGSSFINILTIRKFGFLSTCLWMIYSLFVGNIGVFVANIIVIFLSLYWFIKFKRDNNAQKVELIHI